jgi:thiol:disulfide interchange protein DsbC
MKTLFKSAFFITLLSINTVISMAFAVDTSAQDIKELRQALSMNIPQAAAADITATPVKGVYQFVLGSKVMYMTKDARYIFDGDLIDLLARRNLTEDLRSAGRKKLLDELGEKNMLVYAPEGKTRHTITVFTDIYCIYCRRLHDEMSQYMTNGIKVRYVFLPFKGEKSLNSSVSVWCANNPQQALDKAKADQAIETKTCDHPIEQHKQLATSLGIRGTPAILFENGALSPGYLPAAKVIKQLNGL